MTSYEELLQQREQLNSQIEEARKREMADAVAQVRELVEKYDMTAQDIFKRRSSGGGSKVPPKYRDPVTGKTWSGRGRAPKWIAGRDRSLFLIR